MSERVDHSPRVREAIDELMRKKDATNNRTTELLPCPFCGGEAEPFNPFENTEGTWCVLCSECAAATGFEQTEAEAIEAWNARADDYRQAAEYWKRMYEETVTERTCECVAEYAKSPLDGKTIVLHRCSACHELMRPHMAYCPSCGAKVVGE